MTSPLEQLPNTYRSFFGGFSALAPVQKVLIQPILDGQDVVIQAGTGSGKTEAVLAPATERLMTDPNPFTIIYIVPTRALALDMNRRINPIYKKLGLKSGIRTGDGKTQKNGNPHLLILTPESLDVLLGSQNAENKYFLKHVRIMIIDEVHMFLYEDRGYQLSYLRRRLEAQSIGAVQTLALSATISNLFDTALFFKLKNVFYYQQPATRKLEPCWVHLEDEAQELVPFFNDLLRHWGCRKLLVFANSRKKCEALFDLLSQDGVFSQNVLLHYSNLSTKERRSIEGLFRNNKKSVCIATSTLEMGIDIGDVDGVVLMGPPSSSLAFLQRIGRGNRRQPFIRFWGICYGAKAACQLLQFLALFELAKENNQNSENQGEKPHLADNYSVLFQQILSCLYAKKALSHNSLKALFPALANDCHSIFNEMVAKNWLKPMPTKGLFCGGWRYVLALKQQKIWSNFPPTDEEYDVILEQEKIAVLPLSTVRQLEVGNIVQLTGKVLKVLRIEEKKASREVWVKESNSPANKDLFWAGMGIPTSFEVAQKMLVILSGKLEIQGLLSRTQRLLASMRALIERSVRLPNGIWVHRLGNNTYRYETFLGSTGNFIIHHLIKKQFSSEMVNFDELGIECNAWIPFESLELPHEVSLFQEWVSSHLQLLKTAFPWNSWIRWLSEYHQQKEIASRLLDPRVLECFERYQKTATPLTPPEYLNDDQQAIANDIPLLGAPFSIESERQAWGKLSFPQVPSNPIPMECSLTASQIQGYVTQKLCPRWARFQQLNYVPQSHPRFRDTDQKIQSRQQEGIAFKKQVIDELKNKKNVRWETAKFTWKEAVNEVIATRKPLFIAMTKLEVDRYLKGNPDLIYLKPQGDSICLEIWDIKNGYTYTYAQKWRIAFYAYLLEILLEREDFLLSVKISDLGGIVYRNVDKDKLFERTSFLLAPYKRWLPRLVTQWKTDSMQSSAANNYSMDSTCTSCRYFSYCYQETLFKEVTPIENQAIVSLGVESNDFPKNTKQWFFIYYDKESIRWQCWENKESIRDTCIRSAEYLSWNAFQEEIIKALQSAWHQSIEQGKNPHFLVYAPEDWHFFQKAFQPTRLKSLWAMHSCWTSIQSVLKKHFLWPIPGQLTATQVALSLGHVSDPPQLLSLYHKEFPSDISFDLYRHIWNWCLSQVKSRRTISFDFHSSRSVPLINAYLAIQHRENECRAHEILEFQKNPGPKRVESFRSINPLSFLGTVTEGKQKCYQFSMDTQLPVSKFRVGDFLRLSPVESSQIQEGFSVILESYSSEEGTLSVRPLSQKITLSKKQLYTLDENATDWNAPKIKKILTLLKDSKFRPKLIQMLLGHEESFSSTAIRWVEQWYDSKIQNASCLNKMQKKALMLPFLKNIGLIEGPPGTGKTHLLVWTLLALVAHAKFLNRPIKILVTAQTHHAIDQILKKLAGIFSSTNADKISIWKYGRYDYDQFSQLGIHPLHECKPLTQNASLILGATGFGIYQLLEGKNFPQLFDWVVFDEASQILPYHAALSLIFGKGNALFYGDTQQLPPILTGHYDDTSFVPCSILQELIFRCDAKNWLRLNETYRMNEDICKFASQHWYEGELSSVVSKNHQKLELSRYPLFNDLLDDYLNPARSMVVIPLDHEGCQQSSQEEALWIVKAVQRLIEDYAVSIDEIGIISPHRLQNNTILNALKKALPFAPKMPKVDTVERMQGLEFDIVIFSATVSAKENIHSAFLKDYRRFNVALTRSRKKFLFVASTIFFQSFPPTEKKLIAQFPFEELLRSSSQ